MFTPSQIRRLSILDHLISGRLQPRANVMQNPEFLPGLDQYLEEYFQIVRSSDEISSILLRFGVSAEKKKQIFFSLVVEHAEFVRNRYLPLAPYTDAEILLFYITARRRHMSYSEIGRMIVRYYSEDYTPGMLMDELWRYFEKYSYSEDHDFDP